MKDPEEKPTLWTAWIRLGAYGFLLVALFSLFGCASGRTPCQDLKHTDPLYNILVTPLMASPRAILSDYTHPDRTRQIFSWGPYGGEWRVLPMDQTNAYAGFTLKHPQNLSQHQQTRYLSFRIKPCVRDSYLSLALISRHSEQSDVLSAVPIHSYRIREWGGWGLFAIKIEDFPDRGWVLNTPDDAPQKENMNWSDIRGLRLIAQPHENWSEPLIIRDLQFGPAWPQ